MKLHVSDRAPDFRAPDQAGKIHELGEYAGKWLLVYFYPKDDTPGCTTEACGLRDNFALLQKLVSVVGVSADSIASHQKFAAKYHLPFTLLADPKKEIITAYGTDGLIFAKRTSFLINPEGKIAKVYEKVNPETHSNEIVKDLQQFIPS